MVLYIIKAFCFLHLRVHLTCLFSWCKSTVEPLYSGTPSEVRKVSPEKRCLLNGGRGWGMLIINKQRKYVVFIAL